MNTILLEAQSSMTSIIFLVGMFAVVYFFMIMPQQKRQKEAKKFKDSLKEGQEVVTTGGILGKIVDIKEDIITLEIARSTNIKIEKNSIAGSADKTEKKS